MEVIFTYNGVIVIVRSCDPGGDNQTGQMKNMEWKSGQWVNESSYLLTHKIGSQPPHQQSPKKAERQ